MNTSLKKLLVVSAIAGGLATGAVLADPPAGAPCPYGGPGAGPGAMGYGPGMGHRGNGMGPGGYGMGYGRHGFDSEARIDRMAAMLDLTKEQREKVRAIVDKSTPKTRELRDKLADNRTQLRTLVQQDKAKDADVRKLADEQGKLVAEMIVQRTKVKNEIHAVLTPEQREKVQQRWQNRGHFWGAAFDEEARDPA